MTDYLAIVLNGLFTGIGVIIAHEFWDWFRHYREKVKSGVTEILRQKDTKSNDFIEELIRK